MVIRGVVLTATVLLGACGPSGGTVSLVLDIPNSVLDPADFANVEVRLHRAQGEDIEFNVAVTNGSFDLGPIDVTTGVLIEATLRTEAGAVVGYGRGASTVDLRDKAEIVVPVRRPIVYFSGLYSEDPNPNANNDRTWTKTKPTYYDLSGGAPFDGSTQLMTNALVTVSAGENLFVIDQTPMTPSDMLVLTGPPTIKAVSTADHSIAATPLGSTLDGAVVDAAGTDDGKQLVVATATRLFVVDTVSGMAKPVADGNFIRVAIVSAGDRALTVIAIRKPSATGTCNTELVWAATNSDDTNQVMTLGTSGFTDVAADAGRGFYVDSCKGGGELGEATAAGTQSLRPNLGALGALAVSNGTAWVGLEKTVGVVAVQGIPLAGGDLRTVFEEASSQVVEAFDYPGVLRRLDAEALQFLHLEVGAGGDYLAWTLDAKYHGDPVPEAGMPEMFMQTQELRVIDTSTRAVVQNYRATCEGSFRPTSFTDILDWVCSVSPGQVEASKAEYDHRINSMSFQFGKK